MNTNRGLPLWRNTLTAPTSFRRDFNALFEDCLTPSYRQDRMEAPYLPACDVEEHDSHYLLVLEIPGVKKDHLSMEVVGNQIFISGERPRNENGGDDASIYSERRFGKFQRTFELPSGIDTSQIEANYQDGILRIAVPKAESAKPRQIKINDENDKFKFFHKFSHHSDEKENNLTNSPKKQAS